MSLQSCGHSQSHFATKRTAGKPSFPLSAKKEGKRRLEVVGGGSIWPPVVAAVIIIIASAILDKRETRWKVVLLGRKVSFQCRGGGGDERQ